jgi:inorganic triphosphatase YgiF
VSSPKETEIKLQLPSAASARLAGVAMLRGTDGAKRSERQVSVYFDTKRLKLKRHGLTLRVRQVGDRYIQTVKSEDAGLFDRGEWETEIENSRPDLERAGGSALERLGIKKLRKKLRPVFETRVQRTTYPLARSDIALTIDRGEIGAGRKSMPLYEAELELKRGDRGRLFGLARKFARATSAELAVKSKSQRGYELLAGDGAAAVKGHDIELTADMPAKAAFHAIASACLRQIVANKPAILAGDPEAIHQMRIGLRRLRAALSLFPDIVADAKTSHIKAELKWLTNELGSAREFDVFLSKVVAPLKKHHGRLAGMRGLSRDLADRREAATARAAGAVASKRFRDLALDVATWLETGGWRQPRDRQAREHGEAPIAPVASAQLSRRWKKLRKRGRQLAKLDAEGRHKLRIQAKKLRYATEFYRTVFTGKKTEKRRDVFLAALKDMQDRFGELNDIVVHEKLATGIARTMADRPPRPVRRAFAAGLLTGHEEARFKPVLTAAEHAFRAFEKLKPYWR